MHLGLKDIVPIAMNIDGKLIMVKDEVKLLGVTIDCKLSFSPHSKSLCTTANNKISALIRHRNFMTFSQATVLFNAYILSKFLYCPLIWMFCSKGDMKLINRTHKRALRAVSNDFTLDMPELLVQNKGSTIHVLHLRVLMTEVYKSLKKVNPEIMWKVFKPKQTSVNLRGQLLVKLPPCKTVTYGTNSLVFNASIMWNALPNKFKCLQSVSLFKNHIKEWEGSSCTCNLCK